MTIGDNSNTMPEYTYYKVAPFPNEIYHDSLGYSYGRATRDGSIVESYNFGTSMFIRANPKRKEQIVDFNGELHYYVDIKYYTNPYHKVLDILTGEQFQHHLEMLKLLEV